jgi:hypothetical protein
LGALSDASKLLPTRSNGRHRGPHLRVDVLVQRDQQLTVVLRAGAPLERDHQPSMQRPVHASGAHKDTVHR